jgi:hypothetical protein
MDIKTTRIISIIHFSLISLITFIILISFTVFSLLQSGIVLKELNISNIDIKELKISCDSGFYISVDQIKISKKQSESKSDFSYESIFDIVNDIELFLPLFTQIDIKKISVADTNISLKYKRKQPLYIDLKNKNISLNLNISLNKRHISLGKLDLKTLDGFLHVNAEGYLDREDRLGYFKLQSSILEKDRQNIYIYTDNSGLRFNTVFLTPITKLKEIVDYAHLHKGISPWIVDYAKGDYPVAQKLSGYIPYNNPSEILHTLYAKAYWGGVKYYFQKGFKPAISNHVDIVFEDGVLKILPRNATFYSQDAGETSISIDFKPKEPVLCVHVDTTARLDKNLLRLISSYGIDVPVEQKRGLTRADLKIFVNLITADISSVGDFKIYKGLVNFHGVNYKIEDGNVKLRGTIVTLKDVNATYKEYANAMLSGVIDAPKAKGTLDIDLYDIDLLEHKISLKSRPLHVRYTLVPKKDDILEIDKSEWNFFDKALHVNAIKSDFDYDNLKTEIKPTKLNIGSSIKATTYGKIDIKNSIYNVDLNLSKLKLGNLVLNQNSYNLHLFYDNFLSISSDENSSWNYSTMPLFVDKFDTSLSRNKIRINKAKFILNNDLKSDIVGSIYLDKDKGSFLLDNMSVQTDAIGEIISRKESMPLEVSLKNGHLDISIPSLNFTIFTFKEGWELRIPDISQIEKYSTLMKKFEISKGALHIGETIESNGIYFAGMIEYKYPFLVKDNEPQFTYNFYGTYDENLTAITVNDDLLIEVDDRINLTCKDAGFNIFALVDFIHEHNSTKSDNAMPFSLVAKNSYIYFSKDRRAIADTLTLNYEDDNIFASLIYKDGGAGFEMHEDDFFLYGKNFNDEFMNSFLSLSKYTGGKLSFALKGNINTFKGVARIDNSHIADYVLFNNILAFINTVPSLASFTLPSYERSGIKINEAYTAFEYKNSLMYFNAIKFDSGEVHLYGKGIADYANNKIDINLNLKTNLGKNVGKLPVAGYILVGDDGTAATTLKISGELTNPKVNTTMAKDIVIAPFNILKRAITYPFHLYDILSNKKEQELDPTHFLEQ